MLDFEKMIPITKDEFCEKTGTGADCWIFDGIEQPKFYKREDLTPNEYYFDNNDGIIRAFQYLPEYEETWMLVYYTNLGKHSGLWSTWKEW